MPDAAVEAARLGLPYREPSFSSRKRPAMKVSYVADPNNSTAPPRRIFEKAEKGGWFSRTFGTGVEWDPPHLGMLPNAHSSAMSLGLPNSHSQAMNIGLPPSLGAQMPPQPNQFGHLGQFGQFGQMGYGQGYPGTQFGQLQPPTLGLSYSDRLAWERALKDEERMRERAWAENSKLGKKWRKMEEQRWKEEQKELERRMKVELKEKKAKLKEDQGKHKAILSGTKRWLPRLSAPAGLTPLVDPAVAAAAAAAANAPAGVPQEPLTRWMMLPTGEEFGVRRPFDAPGRPPVRGPGDWPMMSRTMTHAVKDMSLEERVHAVQAGTVWGGSWGGQLSYN